LALKSILAVREDLILKKMFSFGHCPNEGGGRALPELKDTLYIFLYDSQKRCTSCPKEGEGGGGGGGGGEVIWAMPERKHSFFQEVFPKRNREKRKMNMGNSQPEYNTYNLSGHLSTYHNNLL